MIEGVAEATSSLLKLFSGVIMDRTQRAKPWIILGYSLAGFDRPFIAFAGSWGWVLRIRFTDRVDKGLRTSPRDALLTSSADPEQRGLAFGLLTYGMPLKDIFLCAALPAAICLGLVLGIRDIKPAEQLSVPPRFDWRLDDMPPYSKNISSLSRSSPSATPPTCFCCCGQENLACQPNRYPCCEPPSPQ